MQSKSMSASTAWQFKEGDLAIYQPKMKRFGILTPARTVRIMRIYTNGNAKIEIRCGLTQQIKTKSLEPIR